MTDMTTETGSERERRIQEYVDQLRQFSEAVEEEGMDREGLHIAINAVLQELRAAQETIKHLTQGLEAIRDSSGGGPFRRIVHQTLESLPTPLASEGDINMTEGKAKRLLDAWIQKDGSLKTTAHIAISYAPGSDLIKIAGWTFSIEELEAIVWYMRTPSPTAGGE